MESDRGTEARDPRIGGRLLSERLRAERGPITDLVLHHLVAELPVYSALPTEALDSDIVEAIRLAIELFLQTLSSGRMPEDGATASLSESAARRAEEGIPLDMVLQAYHVAVRVVVDRVFAEARPEEVGDVAVATRTTLDFLTTIVRVVSASYLDVSGALTGIAADASASRFRALLAGSGHEPEVPYLVIDLQVGPHPDEAVVAGAATSPPVAAHRKLRRLRARLLREFPDALSSLTPQGGVVLVPVASEGPDAEALADALARAWPRMQEAAGADLWGTLAIALGPIRIPEAARMAGELRDLVRALGKPPGLHRLEDVAFEYQVTRQGPARALLAATVAPLVDRPELLETLAVHVRHGQNRRASAQVLRLHPNSVDYRLQRIRSILGLDVSDPRHASTLAASLVASELERGVGDSD